MTYRILAQATSAAPSNCQQSLSFDGTATAGTFTLSFLGQTTDAIDFNATGSAVQSALEALSTVGSGNVAVTTPTPPGWEIEFIGVLGQSVQPTISVNDSSISGSTMFVNADVPGGTSLSELYSPGTDMAAVCSTLVITNCTNSTATYHVLARPSTAIDGITGLIVCNAPLDAYEFRCLTIGITLGPLDTVGYEGSIAGINFTLFGDEIAQPAGP